MFGGEIFTDSLLELNAAVLSLFGNAYSTATALMLIVCIIIPFTPFGKIRIGGPSAVPFFSKGRWFAIVLCTTIATGILFWGTAEPLFHYTAPPEGSGIAPGSDAAVRFSLTTLFLHWSFSPYAIYTVPALLFAVVYYNGGGRFSISSVFMPLAGGRILRRISPWVDTVALFGLVMGMSASLGAGVLTLKGGLDRITTVGLPDEVLTAGIALAVIAAFTVSASTGLFRGIKHLSLLNFAGFLVLLVFAAAAGSTDVYAEAGRALLDYPAALIADGFLPPADEDWSHRWTAFYWANWMAWAPVTALFLGRLAYGRTVREFMAVNWLLPSLFALIWMTIFGGNVLEAEHTGTSDLSGILAAEGPEAVVYALFELLPAAVLVTLFFVLVTFLSYTTAADSNTEAMGGISTRGISPESPAPPVFIKVIWGALIGAVAVIALGFAGIDGIRLLSNLGGLPALFFLAAATAALIAMLMRPGLYVFREKEKSGGT